MMKRTITFITYLMLFGLCRIFGADVDWTNQASLMGCPCDCDKNKDLAVLRTLYNDNGGANWQFSEAAIYQDILNDNQFENVPNAGVAWEVDATNAADLMGNWHGVVTNEAGCVTDLILWAGPYNLDNQFNFAPQGVGLTDTLPESIGDLCALRRLMIPHNDLVGTLPASIVDLCDLEVLLLHNNQLEGTLPNEMGSLQNLVHLGLHYNSFSGNLPDNFTDLTELVILHLQANNFLDTIPTTIGNLDKILFMDLSDNAFSGTVPISIVNVGNNSFRDSLPFGRIIALSLQNNQLDSLPFINSLQVADDYTLDVSGNHFTFDDIIPNINILTNYENQTLDLNQFYCAKVGDALVIRPGFDQVVDEGIFGELNTYHWSRPGTSYRDTSNQNFITFSGVTLNSAGNFSIGVTNSLAPDLRLEVTNLIVEVVQPPALIGLTEVCANARHAYTVFGSGGYDFTVESGTIIEEDSTSLTVEWGDNAGQICATNRADCNITTCFDINVAPSIEVSIAPPETLTCDKRIDTLESITVGEDLTFRWTDAQGTLLGESTALEVMEAGNYILEITNADGCRRRDSVLVIEEVDEFQVNIIGENTFCAGTTTILSVDTNFDTYAWSTGDRTSAIEVAAEGDYEVTVTNANNCTATETISVSILNIPPAVINKSGDLDCSNDEVQLFNANVNNQTTSEWLDTEGGLLGTAPILTVNDPGIYTLLVTSETGCTNSEQIEVLEDNSVIIPLISGTTSLCEGATGELSVDEIYSSYLWSTGATTASIPIDGSIIAYSVTVTDDSGCSGSNTVEIIQASKPFVAIGGQTAFCEGGETRLFVNDTFSSYNWSNGSTTFETTVNTAGTYTVTVTNENSCTNTATIEVTETPPFTAIIEGATSFCAGTSASLFANLVNNATYQWSTGDNASFIIVDTPGTYGLTITDGNNCSSTANRTVTTLATPNIDIIGSDKICADGTTSLEVNQVFPSYLWSNGETTKRITVDEPGIYTVTVRDEFECRNTDSMRIEESPTLIPTIIRSSALCEGSVVILSSDDTYTSYEWSDGATERNILINTEGTYSLTVTDENGCTGSTSINIEATTNPIPQIIGNTSLCRGTATNLTTLTDYAAYLWSTGEQTEAISINNAGTYTVTVTDDSGCTGINSLIVSEAPEIEFEIVGNTAICAGASTILQADNDYLTYRWSTGESTAGIEVSEVGIYTLTVTDQSGCTGSTTVEVTENSSIFPQITGITTLCGGNPTEISADADYTTYNWSTGAITKSIEVTTPGLYQVTVSNETGCTGITSINIEATPALAPTIQGTETFCEGQTLTLNLDTVYSNYLWTGGIVRPTLEVSKAGVYTVTVTDNLGCTGETAITIEQGALAPPNISPEEPTICGGDLIVLTAERGFASYLWSNGNTGPNLLTTEAQFYSLTVTDDNGCTGVNTVEVAQLPSPEIMKGETPTLCAGSTDSVLLALDGFARYQWSTGDTSSSIYAYQSGTYNVTVTNEEGCFRSTSYEVTEFEQPTLFIRNRAGEDTLDCETDELFLVGISDNSLTYRWENQNGDLLTTEQIARITEGGTYRVIGTDNTTRCQVIVEKNVPQLENTVSLELSNEVQSLSCDNPQTTISFANSINADSYEWQQFNSEGFGRVLQGVTSESYIAEEAGAYLVIGIDAQSGCRDSARVELADESYTVQPTIVGSRELCEKGTSQLAVGDTFQQYNWNNGATGQQIDITEAGYYEVTVTDENACTGVEATNISLKEQTELDVVLEGDASEICEGEEVEIDFMVQGGVGPYNLTLFDGQGEVFLDSIQNNEEITVLPTNGNSYAIVDIEDIGNECSVYNDVSSTLTFDIQPLPILNAAEFSSCNEQGFVGATFNLRTIVDAIKENPNYSVRWYSDSTTTNRLESNNSLTTSTIDTVLYAKVNNGICDSKPAPITLQVRDCSNNIEMTLESGMDLDLSHLSGNQREVYITNRWGDLVYASADYEGSADKFNGNDLPQGAYYIYIKNQERIDDTPVPYKGVIYLLK